MPEVNVKVPVYLLTDKALILIIIDLRGIK